MSLKKMKETCPLFFENGRGRGEKYNVSGDYLFVTRFDEFQEKRVTKAFHFDECDARLLKVGPDFDSLDAAKSFVSISDGKER